MHKWLGTLLLVLGMSLSSVRAAAQDQEDAFVSRARELAMSGLIAYDAGRFDEAVEKLSAAYLLVRLPTLAVSLARAQTKLGRLVEAAALYQEAARLEVDRGDPETQRQAKVHAKQERAALLRNIPRLKLIIEGADREVVVEVDGVRSDTALLRLGLLVDPGHRRISVRCGEQTREQTVDVAVGEHRAILFRFRPQASHDTLVSSPPVRPLAAASVAAESRWRGIRGTIAWSAIGVGAVGLAVGAVSAALVYSKRQYLLDQCPDHECPPPYHDDLDEYQTLRTVSTTGFVLGAAGLAAGLTLHVVDHTNEQRNGRIATWLGPGQAGIAASF
jgi:tetratricopeptide (TPR) repeat protein